MKTISESTFLLYAAKNYANPNCLETGEFLDDVKRFKYIKKHFSKYRDSHELKERLILNHIIILFNVFESEAITRMLFYKLRDYLEYLRPFLILLNRDPDTVYGIGAKSETIYNFDITPDSHITELLKKI